MDHSQVKQIQEQILLVFNEFSRICSDNNLRYFAIGGTCIGAVRHKGFIPWDDDLDVAMPGEDYLKFIEICKNQLQKPFEIIGAHNCSHFKNIYCKLHNTDTTLIENNDKNYPDRYSGVFIDVFPICGLPKNKNESDIFLKEYRWLKRLNRTRRYGFYEQNSVLGKLLWVLMKPFNCFINEFYYIRKANQMICQHSLSNSRFLFFTWREKAQGCLGSYQDKLFSEDFADSIVVPFEDTTIQIPVGYERYLTMEFGNYMKLPPKDKQVSNHDIYILDLKKSYKRYC